MYIAAGQGQTTPEDKILMSAEHLVTSVIYCKFPKIHFEVWFYTILFHDFIHVYSPRAGADSPQGQSFDVNRKKLVTLIICCKFKKKMSLKSGFIYLLSWFNIVLGQWQIAPGVKVLMSTERPYHFTHLLQVSKKSLWSLILYNFFHDLIFVYNPGAGGIQPSGDKVLKSTEITCHLNHLLQV